MTPPAAFIDTVRLTGRFSRRSDVFIDAGRAYQHILMAQAYKRARSLRRYEIRT